MEFGGWLFQDAGDLICAMHWTDRALDYGLEKGKALLASLVGSFASVLEILQRG